MKKILITSFLIMCSSLSALSEQKLLQSFSDKTVFKDIRQDKKDRYLTQNRSSLLVTYPKVETGLSSWGFSLASSKDINSKMTQAALIESHFDFQAKRDIYIKTKFTYRGLFEYKQDSTGMETTICKKIDLDNHKFYVGLSAFASLENNKNRFYALPCIAYLYKFDENTFLSVGYVDQSLLHISHTTQKGKLTTKLKLAETGFLYLEDEIAPMLKNEIGIVYRVNSIASVGFSTGFSAVSRVDDDLYSLKAFTNALTNASFLPHLSFTIKINN